MRRCYNTVLAGQNGASRPEARTEPRSMTASRSLISSARTRWGRSSRKELAAP